MKIAFVYDWVNKFGGAERILLALREIWPDAPLFTSVYNPKTAPWAEIFAVRPSFLQNFPRAKTHHEFYPWLQPLAFESFQFDDFEVVISITSSFAKGIITKPKTAHICYCLTPTRFLWSGYGEYFSSPLLRSLTIPVVAYLRLWDQVAGVRPDEYLAISQTVRRRIKKYYGRESFVIYPPVDIEKFQLPNFSSSVSNNYFLLVSRLERYKRVDLAIEAFNYLGLPLKIIGRGREERHLKRMARENIEFLGNLTDEELVGYYQGCQALIFPQEEDLGLVAIEAQACGKPVIAYRGGGALETVQEGITGEFFSPQTSMALAEKILSFQKEKFNPKRCRENAERFGKEIFKKKFKSFIENVL